MSDTNKEMRELARLARVHVNQFGKEVYPNQLVSHLNETWSVVKDLNTGLVTIIMSSSYGKCILSCSKGAVWHFDKEALPLLPPLRQQLVLEVLADI